MCSALRDLRLSIEDHVELAEERKVSAAGVALSARKWKRGANEKEGKREKGDVQPYTPSYGSAMATYRFSKQYNDSYAFRTYPTLREWQKVHQELLPDMSGSLVGGHKRCAQCGALLYKWNEPLVGLKIKKRSFDLSVTYDGITVVSQRFRRECESHGLCGLVFEPLPDDPEFYLLKATRRVPFDAERRRTRFLKQCPMCGEYESVIGAHPVYLKEGAVIGASEFAWTDLDFGTGDGKGPVFLCGANAREQLLQAKLTGIAFAAI